MQHLIDLITFIGTYCIRGIFISVLVILIIKLCFKDKVETHYAALIIKLTILSYSFLQLIYIGLVFFLLQPEPHLDFIFGKYFWAYWMMFFFSTIFPLLLLFKTWGQRLSFLFLVSLLMNIGWLFEFFVIHATSLHRDYGTADGYSSFARESTTLLHGLYWGIAALLAGTIMKLSFQPKSDQ